MSYTTLAFNHAVVSLASSFPACAVTFLMGLGATASSCHGAWRLRSRQQGSVRASMPTSAPSDVLLRLSFVCFNEAGQPVDFLRNTPFVVRAVDGKTEKDALDVAVSRVICES